MEPLTTGSATEEGGQGLQGITASDAVSLYGSCQLSTPTPPLVPTEALVLSEVAMGLSLEPLSRTSGHVARFLPTQSKKSLGRADRKALVFS